MSDTSSSWRDRLTALETLPMLPSAALRFIELGKDPDAELEDYVEAVQVDASLSSKILSLANSAWIAPSHEITAVKKAVGLLGMNNVRTLAISSCLAGLHSAWKLEPEEGKALWEASLCKAVTAKLLVQPSMPKRADEALALGLFQDIGLGLFVATAGGAFAQRLLDPDFTVHAQLQEETARFGVDHAECGRVIAERLRLPGFFLTSIGLHHERQQLAQELNSEHLAVASHVVSLLPHDIRAWKQNDLGEMTEVLENYYGDRWSSFEEFLQETQGELDDLIIMLNQRSEKMPSLAQLVQEACAENVRCTTALVGQMQSLISSNNDLTSVMNQMVQDQCTSEMRANHDRLTGLLNREGFLKLARHAVAKLAATGQPGGVAVFDLDRFKQVNDTHGHACGDALLRLVADHLRTAVRRNDLIGRWGGDEFVIFWEGLREVECIQAALRCQQAAVEAVLKWENNYVSVAMTGGLRWISRMGLDTEVSGLIDQADQAFYQAKRSQRGSLVSYRETAQAQSPLAT